MKKKLAVLQKDNIKLVDFFGKQNHLVYITAFIVIGLVFPVTRFRAATLADLYPASLTRHNAKKSWPFLPLTLRKNMPRALWRPFYL